MMLLWIGSAGFSEAYGDCGFGILHIYQQRDAFAMYQGNLPLQPSHYWSQYQKGESYVSYARTTACDKEAKIDSLVGKLPRQQTVRRAASDASLCTRPKYKRSITSHLPSVAKFRWAAVDLCRIVVRRDVLGGSSFSLISYYLCVF